ncbi:MAG: hypothetical protein FJX75_10000 [Armatimonadetes bacterium]|nr:hypothetical protein [Armatimonadota bacterium]
MDTIIIDVIIRTVGRALVTLGLMATRRCNWQTATLKLEAWESWLKDSTTLGASAARLAIVGGLLILLAALLVFLAIRSMGS